MTTEPVTTLLDKALAARNTLFDARHETAFRLFDGFSEGLPQLVIDLYAATAVIHNYADPAEAGEAAAEETSSFLLERLPWLQSIMLKTRNSPIAAERNGRLIHGEIIARRVKENGVWYAIDPDINRDAGFYLDTRNLREWVARNLKGKSVLNTFAYTGSLGVAAMAGGATRVVQTDLSRNFLNQAKTSYSMNGFPIVKKDFIAGDFFRVTSQFKRHNETFDCIILDPPFFSVTDSGKVDQLNNCTGLINKVRPLIADGGYLVAVNNAIFLKGSDYMKALEDLCSSGYLEICEIIPIPEYFTGYESTRVNAPITDPAPFNHSTKIVVLKAKRKAKQQEKITDESENSSTDL